MSVDEWPSFGLRSIFARRGLDEADARALYEAQCAIYTAKSVPYDPRA